MPNLEPLGLSTRILGIFGLLSRLFGDREGGVGRYGYGLSVLAQ